MGNRDPASAAEDLHTLFVIGTVAAFSDGQLLERFVSRSGALADAAFATLVQRHGAMVMRVCAEILGDVHLSEDAFQATFLILASRARSIRNRDSVASWLFGVARRVAIRAKVDRGRRAALERRAPIRTENTHRDGLALDVVREVRDAVERLPEKYRAPIVLCDLGGLTHEHAAQQLHVPVGTVKIRLHRARKRLRARLTHRGLAPSLIALALAEATASAAPPPPSDSLIHHTARLATDRALAVPSSVATLVTGVLKTMFLAKLKSAAILIAGGLAILFAGSIAPRTFPRSAQSAQTPEPSKSTEVVKVVVDTVKRADISRKSAQIGTVHPFESVAVYPKSSGYLRRLLVDIGDRVRKGQVLAEIDAPELIADASKNGAMVKRANSRVLRARAAQKVAEAAVGVAEAGSDQARADIAKYEATLRFRERELVRYQELEKQKAVPQQIVLEQERDLDEARANVMAAKSQVTSARAMVQEARAKVDATKVDIEEALAELEVARAEQQKSLGLLAATTITAPFDGVVDERNYHAGEFVRSGADGGSRSIVHVMRTDLMRVITHVPDRDAPLLQTGERATIELEALDRVFEGTLARTAYAEDPESRTLRAEIDLANTDGRLRPGQFGTCTIYLVHAPNRLTIRSSAIVGERRPGGQATCFHVQGGRAVRTEIKVGADDGKRVEVIDGLKEGDAVVYGSEARLSDGQAIERIPDAPAPPGR